MSSSIHLDYSPSALFPKMTNAEANEKCQIISKLFQEISADDGLCEITQEILIKQAKKRYRFLSENKEVPDDQLKQMVLLLIEKGAKRETALKFYSFVDKLSLH